MNQTRRIVRTLFIILTLLTAFGAERAPAQGTATDSLREKIQTSFNDALLGRRARISVYVVDTSKGIPFLEMNSNEAMKPGSLMKLITTGAALKSLGPDYRFTTSVETSGEVSGNVLNGDILIRGGGDPSLGARFSAKPDDTLGVLRDWATKLREMKIRKINGDIVGVDNRYKFEPHALGLNDGEYGEWYCAEVSALNFNHNVVDVIARGTDSGDPAKYDLDPVSNYYRFSSTVRTGPPSMSKAFLRFLRAKESNEIRMRGRIPPGTSQYEFASIHDPANWTAFLFGEVLQKDGVKVTGNPLSIHEGASDDRGTTTTRVLFTHQSPPLIDLVKVINKESQNLYAEAIAREVAHQAKKDTNFKGASTAITDWLIANGLYKNGFLMVDGSGLSSLNRISTRMLGDYLLYIHRSPQADLFEGSLAVAGVDGSLKHRFAAVPLAKTNSSIIGKTGFVEGCHSLAGYMTNSRGSGYAFVVILNDYDMEKSLQARNLLDTVVGEIVMSEILP